MVDLSGTWRAHPAEGELHREFVEPGFHDADWLDVPVPGHWRSVPELSDEDGPLLYRTTFETDALGEGRRRFLVFDGIFYDADVWLDGRYLGATVGYFLPHAFDVSDATRGGETHHLAVEVACAPQEDRTTKRLITGVFSHWDCLDATWNPGGVWRPVRVVETGPARVEAARVVCAEATEERGRLRVHLSLDAGAGGGAGVRPASLLARLRGPGVEREWTQDIELAAGVNHQEWVLEVDRPPLWWPRRLGHQPLCDLHLEVRVDGEVSDSRHVRTAFREVRLDDWKFHLNGERMYVMGANHGPTRMQLGEASADELRRDVELAVEGNLDMLRIHGHVTRPELYEAADEAGLLLWQDFPLQWGYARGLRKEATRQARAMVDQLGHHPSIALWCAHNEPLAVDVPTGAPITPGVAAKVVASMVAPTWNKQVLDRSIRRTIEKADRSRPVNPHSGIFPGPTEGGTDSHLYFGWYYGHLADLAPTLKAWPRLARFVSEFGAQAVPEDADFFDEEGWPDLDWDHLLERHAAQKVYFDETVPPADYPDLESWAAATRAYQAALLQLQVEDLRRLKYRPGGGFLQFSFADALPAVTWAVLDHARRPKPGFEVLRGACRPVLPMLDPRTGDVHVVNEERTPLTGAVVSVRAGDERRRFSGEVAADSVTYVGSLGGPAHYDEACVTLEHPDVGEVVNDYGPVLLHRIRHRLGT